MSGVPYQSFVSSKPFLVTGPGKRLFYVHGNLLSQSSPVLRKDVLGGMQETQLQAIEIRDVDGDIDDDTVMRFIEYAYSGDYTVPEPDIVQLPSDSRELEEAFRSVTSPVTTEDEWAVPLTSKKGKKDKKKKKKLTLFEDDIIPEPEVPCAEESVPAAEPISMEEVEPPAIEIRPNPRPAIHIVESDRQKVWASFRAKAWPLYRSVWQPRDSNDEREDYTAIFLCHARLYKFSDRYGCEKLMKLTLQKLRSTLSKYKFYSIRASDVIELVRYTYAHTTDFESQSDKLRALVLDYVVCYFRELMNSSSFREFLQEGGSLSLELMVRIAELVA